jgi:hypothetical protein
VTLAVTGNTISGRDFRRQRVTVLQRHRMPLTGSRWDIRWLIGRGTTPTFCVFPVFSVAVMEKCCDACGDEEYYFRSAFSASEGAGVSEASIAVDRKSMGHTVADRSWNEADFLCISCILSVAVTEKCCDACGDGEYCFRSNFADVRGCRCFRGIGCR